MSLLLSDQYVNKDTHTHRFIRLHTPFQLKICLKEELIKSKIQSASKVLGGLFIGQYKPLKLVVFFKPAYRSCKEFFCDSEKCPSYWENETQTKPDFSLLAQQTRH